MTNAAEIYREAFDAASAAVEACGPEDTRSFNCGFAWVTIRPARGEFVKYCKANKIGEPGWNGGWCVWNPGQFMGQQVDHKRAGAVAFAAVLDKHGVSASVGSRLD